MSEKDQTAPDFESDVDELDLGNGHRIHMDRDQDLAGAHRWSLSSEDGRKAHGATVPAADHRPGQLQLAPLVTERRPPSLRLLERRAGAGALAVDGHRAERPDLAPREEPERHSLVARRPLDRLLDDGGSIQRTDGGFAAEAGGR